VQSVRNNAVIIGAVLGLVLGATAGWAYGKEKEGKYLARNNVHPIRLQAGPTDFAKIGIALLALVRQVDDLFKPD
jgi:hypothetical protein